MSKIYVPQDNVFNKCYVVQNENIIRAYDKVPQNNLSYNYRDYYINSNYIYKDGNGQWSQYTVLPICLNSSDITHDYYYRIDFVYILIIFAIMFYFIIGLPYKIVSRAFGRWLRIW